MKYNLLALLFTVVALVVNGQKSSLYQELELGNYSVGFQEIKLKDYSRIYKDDFRSIQLAVWFPIENPKGDNVKVIDYLSLYNSEDKHEDTVDIITFWKNQFKRLNKYSTIDKLNQTRCYSTFEQLSQKLDYPLILYAAGGQGESFENFLLCEVLASKGFVVAAIPSIGTHIHEIEINEEGLATQTQDLLTVLSYLNEHDAVGQTNIGSMGWSWGGLASLYLQSNYPNVNAFVSLDASIAGYQEVLENLPYYGVEKITAPSLYFATAEDTKVRSKQFIDKLIYSNATFISLDSIQHGDFNSYSYLANQFADSLPSDNILNFQRFMINTVSDFFVQQLLDEKKVIFEIERKPYFIDTVAYRSGIEAPLREDELISLIQSDGVVKGMVEYEKMKKLNPDYVPFHAFELTKLAFALQRDSSRTDESVAVMNIVIKEYPNSASSYALRGRIYEIRGENILALKDFKKAVQLKENQDVPDEVVFYEDVNWYKKKIDELEKSQ